MAWYRDRGAVNVLVAQFIHRQDKVIVPDPPMDRMIGIAPETLRWVPVRMLVALGVQRVGAVHATLSGGDVSHLVVDEAAALARLDTDAEAARARAARPGPREIDRPATS